MPKDWLVALASPGSRRSPYVSLLAVALGAFATDPGASPQFRARVDLVRFDVTVHDVDRRAVHGLQASDFEIVDAGERYVPSFIEEIVIDDEGTAVGPRAWLSDEAGVWTNAVDRGRRLIIIVLDDAMLPGPDRFVASMLERSKASAHAVVDRLTGVDQAAVVFTFASTRAQNFTSDKRELRRAIDSLGPGLMGAHRNTGMEFSDELYMRASLRTLEQIAETLAAVPDRRKALIYISAGVPINYGDAATAIGVDGAGVLQGRVFQGPLREQLMTILHRAQLANVAVYPISAVGVGAEIGSAPTDTMQVLADQTGGFSVVNVNDPERGVEAIFRDNSSYYILGYEPRTRPEPGEFRQVEVNVHRAGLVVEGRKGYFAPEERAEPPTVDERLADALAGVMPVGQMPMRLAVAPTPRDDEASLVYAAEFRHPPALEPVEERVEILVTAFDDQGKARASQRQVAEVSVLPSNQEARFEVVGRLDLAKEGRYSVRMSAYNAERDELGSVFAEVTVPRFGRDEPVLSGLLLTSSSAPMSATAPDIRQELPVVPTTQRMFGIADKVEVFWQVDRRDRDRSELAIDVTIRNSAGAIVFSDAITLAASSTTPSDVKVGIPVAQIGTGDYELAVTVRGRDEGQRSTRFVVR